MDPGLDKADGLAPGRGWLAADIRVTDEKPVEIIGEAGIKATKDLALYADAWVRPTVGQYGGDLGARIKQNLDLYLSGEANTRGDWQASAGVKWRF